MIVSHHKKTWHATIVEDSRDLDCDGSCKVDNAEAGRDLGHSSIGTFVIFRLTNKMCLECDRVTHNMSHQEGTVIGLDKDGCQNSLRIFQIRFSQVLCATLYYRMPEWAWIQPKFMNVKIDFGRDPRIRWDAGRENIERKCCVRYLSLATQFFRVRFQA